MRFYRPFDEILNSRVKVRLLRLLCQKGGEWTGRQLAAELRISPAATHAALRALHQATILELRTVGNSFVYSLRDEQYLVREALRPLFRQEARASQQLRDVLVRGLDPRVRASIVTVALYGSVPRGQERPTSDIDLLVLVASGRAKAAIRRALDLGGDPITRTFGNPIAWYVTTVQEARQKVRRRSPLFHNILRDHQLVWGRPLTEVLDGAA